MAEKASQTTWGLLILAIASVYLHSLIISRAYHADVIITQKYYLWYHRITSYVSLALWFIITSMLVIGNYQSTGSIVYSMITLFFAIEIVREES